MLKGRKNMGYNDEWNEYDWQFFKAFCFYSDPHSINERAKHWNLSIDFVDNFSAQSLMGKKVEAKIETSINHKNGNKKEHIGRMYVVYKK